MITKQQLLTLPHGTRLLCITTGKHWRISGKVKTWVRDPSRFEVPIKFGLYRHAYVTDANCHLFAIVEAV